MSAAVSDLFKSVFLKDNFWRIYSAIVSVKMIVVNLGCLKRIPITSYVSSEDVSWLLIPNGVYLSFLCRNC